MGMHDTDLDPYDGHDPAEADPAQVARRRRELSCADGMCGGCPRCLEAQGMTDEDDEDSEQPA